MSGPPATVGSYALAGADTPADVRRLRAAFDAPPASPRPR